jgi:hypothetical protein
MPILCWEGDMLDNTPAMSGSCIDDGRVCELRVIRGDATPCIVASPCVCSVLLHAVGRLLWFAQLA